MWPVLATALAYGFATVALRVFGARRTLEQTDDDLTRHGIFSGATGSGKTTGMLNQLRRFCRRKFGIVWLGLDRNDCKKAYAVAKQEGMRVRWVDPTQSGAPTYNLLHQITQTEGEIEQLASEFLSVLRQVNGIAWGPKLAQAVEEATIALLESGQEITPADVAQTLEATGEENAASKVRRLLTTASMRRFLGTSGDFTFSAESGEVLIVCLDLGDLGPDRASMLAQVCASGMFRAGLLHSPQNALRAFFMDEWQLYAGQKHPLMLEQLRRRGVTVQAAMQHMHQADARLQAAIRQVGSLLLYQLEPTDAKFFGDLLQIDYRRLANLPVHMRLARERVHGRIRVEWQHNAEFSRRDGRRHRQAPWVRVARRARARLLPKRAYGPKSPRAPHEDRAPQTNRETRARDLPPREMGGPGGTQGGSVRRDPPAQAPPVEARGASAGDARQGRRAPAPRRASPLARGGAQKPRKGALEDPRVPGVVPAEEVDLTAFRVPGSPDPRAR